MRLIYVADPMCSWCYGFAPVLDELTRRLLPSVTLRYVLGGLAPDSEAPMPDATREMVQQAWRDVERTTGVQFNHDFWTNCQPRRSTYPACRAVLAAESLRTGAGAEVFRGIQRAYYREARNPSDVDVLVEVGVKAGFDESAFEEALQSPSVEEELQGHLRERARLGVEVGAAGFPTLAVENGGRVELLTSGYCDWEGLEARLLRSAASILAVRTGL